jgi:hypothetical protein
MKKALLMLSVFGLLFATSFDASARKCKKTHHKACCKKDKACCSKGKGACHKKK